MRIELLEARCLLSASIGLGSLAAKPKITAESVINALLNFQNSGAKMSVKAAGHKAVGSSGQFYLQAANPTTPTSAFSIKLVSVGGVAPFPDTFTFNVNPRQPLNLFNITRRIGKNTLHFVGTMNKSLAAFNGSLVVHTPKATQSVTYAATPTPETITTVNFEDLPATPSGVDLGSPYDSQGIAFSTPGFIVKTWDDPTAIIPSRPNFLDVDIDQHPTASLYFVDPTDPTVPAVVDYFAFDNVGLNPINHGWYNGLAITARDINGNAIASLSIDPAAPNSSRSVFQTAIRVAGIHLIDFTAIPNPYNSNALAPIDDFSFGEPNPVTVASEPSTTINFDDIPANNDGVDLGSPYVSRGIVFNTPGFLVKTNSNPAVIVPSGSDFLDLNIKVHSTASLYFVQPGNASVPAVTDFFSFDNAGLNSINNGWYNGLTILTRDINGKVIGTYTIPPDGPNATRPVFKTTITEPGIHSIDFAVIPNTHSENALAPIDDFSFGPASSGAPAESLTTLNFDDVPGGGANTPLGSPYASRGIAFDSPGFLVKTNNNPAVGVPSSPNFLDLSLTSTLTTSLHFVDPTNSSTPATVDYFSFNNAALLTPDGWYNGLTITTRDINGNIIGVFTVEPIGPSATRPVFQLAISEPGIHSIDFAVIANPFSIHALAPVDDFVFTQPTA